MNPNDETPANAAPEQNRYFAIAEDYLAVAAYPEGDDEPDLGDVLALNLERKDRGHAGRGTFACRVTIARDGGEGTWTASVEGVTGTNRAVNEALKHARLGLWHKHGMKPGDQIDRGFWPDHLRNPEPGRAAETEAQESDEQSSQANDEDYPQLTPTLNHDGFTRAVRGTLMYWFENPGPTGDAVTHATEAITRIAGMTDTSWPVRASAAGGDLERAKKGEHLFELETSRPEADHVNCRCAGPTTEAKPERSDDAHGRRIRPDHLKAADEFRSIVRANLKHHVGTALGPNGVDRMTEIIENVAKQHAEALAWSVHRDRHDAKRAAESDETTDEPSPEIQELGKLVKAMQNLDERMRRDHRRAGRPLF